MISADLINTNISRKKATVQMSALTWKLDLEVQRLVGVAADVGWAAARDPQHEARILETAQPTPGCSTGTVLATFAQGLSQAGEFPD